MHRKAISKYAYIVTTGNFTSAALIEHELSCQLPVMDNLTALAIGEVAKNLGLARNYPIAIEIRFGVWTIFKAALPGSKPENDGWINRKANVVNLKGHSTMFERVKAEEDGIDWHLVNGVVDETHAIHGGGFPLITKNGELKGLLVISGLPQVDDHLFAVEVLTTYLQNQVG